MAGVHSVHSSTYLFDVPPLLIEEFCFIIDSGDECLGWRSLASRILPRWNEMRLAERFEIAGKSPTRELLWTWALQNKTVGDLLYVLEDMGHRRAAELFAVLPSGVMPPVPSDWSCLSKPKDSTSVALQQELRMLDPEEPLAGWRTPYEGQRSFNQNNIITYSDVVEATQNFHPSLKVGDGLWSEVYKGMNGNNAFAVKVFKQVKNKSSWKKQWNQFKMEVQVLQLYKHPNILELWGCFSESDRYYLVRPYLVNGSLSHRLHSQVDTGEPLSWQVRLGIIKGTVTAVHYLHTMQPCAVVCGNVTSKNILLDDDLTPKLCDLGTAHLRPHYVSQSWIVTMETGQQSTLGFLPEEYIRDGKLSTKVDIYSLGVVILETLTGQKAVQEGRGHRHLAERLREALEEGGSVDSCLLSLDPRAGCWSSNIARCLFHLGLECSATRPRNRPSADSVLQMLRKLQSCPPESDTLSLPVEDDETQSLILASAQSHPFECSQSEVTYLSSGSDQQEPASVPAAQNSPWGWESPDLYTCWPVLCSCTAESDLPKCEDCRANGFAPVQAAVAEDLQDRQTVAENPAKARLKEKIERYHQGLINTEELLSVQQDLNPKQTRNQKNQN